MGFSEWGTTGVRYVSDWICFDFIPNIVSTFDETISQFCKSKLNLIRYKLQNLIYK